MHSTYLATAFLKLFVLSVVTEPVICITNLTYFCFISYSRTFPYTFLFTDELEYLKFQNKHTFSLNFVKHYYFIIIASTLMTDEDQVPSVVIQLAPLIVKNVNWGSWLNDPVIISSPLWRDMTLKFLRQSPLLMLVRKGNRQTITPNSSIIPLLLLINY